MQPMDDPVSDASSLDTSRRTALNSHTAPGAEQEDMCPQGALLNSRATGQIRKKIVRAMELTEKNTKGHKTSHSFCTSITDVSTAPVITNLTIVLQQHQTNTTSSPASGPGIYQNTNKFANTLHISQQSQSTVGITTPTLPVTNPPLQHNFQHPLPINPHLNYQAWPPHFQQFTQPQVSPLQTPPQPFNPQILPPYFPQYPPSNSPSAGSNDSSILAALQKQWESKKD